MKVRHPMVIVVYSDLDRTNISYRWHGEFISNSYFHCAFAKAGGRHTAGPHPRHAGCENTVSAGSAPVNFSTSAAIVAAEVACVSREVPMSRVSTLTSP